MNTSTNRTGSEEPILIASDHGGFELKTCIQKELSNYAWTDLGPSDDQRVDYPDFAQKLAEKVQLGEVKRGILICTTGIGMSIVANRFSNVRAALVTVKQQAELTRKHNDSNVLCLSGGCVSTETNLEIVKTWLSTAFSEEERHQRRVNKINQLGLQLRGDS